MKVRLGLFSTVERRRRNPLKSTDVVPDLPFLVTVQDRKAFSIHFPDKGYAYMYYHAPLGLQRQYTVMGDALYVDQIMAHATKEWTPKEFRDTVNPADAALRNAWTAKRRKRVKPASRAALIAEHGAEDWNRHVVAGDMETLGNRAELTQTFSGATHNDDWEDAANEK